HPLACRHCNPSKGDLTPGPAVSELSHPVFLPSDAFYSSTGSPLLPRPC
ncbi:hypothetical protein CABS01_05245, partial [Colletotrichum abscissum]